MPTYEYACSACGHKFEEFQSIKAKPTVKCPKCGKRKVKRYGEDEIDNDNEPGYNPDAADLIQTRTVSLLNREKAAQRLTLPSQAKTDPHPFEVIGIPMPQPGFHVVEIESPKLGQVLLDRNAPMFVRTSVLVTNLGVHFKWAPVNSGAWVTSLDKGKPVPGAAVQVSDCHGQKVWSGQTDAQGFAHIDQHGVLPVDELRRGERADFLELHHLLSSNTFPSLRQAR